jgi:muramoyltetrapeptide carboxypeptidase
MNLVVPRTFPKLTKPPRLKSGDKVAIIAPGSPPDLPDVIEKSEKLLRESGFDVVLGAHVNDRNGFLAGSDENRLKDLSNAIASDDIRAIFCVRGGYGTGRIAMRTPFEDLRKNPKIILGSSDLTNLLYGSCLDGEVISFHGPTLQSLVAEDCPDYTKRSFIQTITGDPSSLGSILKGYQSTTSIESLHPGRATARLVGGNLSILLSSLGTRLFPSFDDSILFLEDIGETPYRIDRYLTQLLNIGALNKVKGFALGIFHNCCYAPHLASTKQSLRDVVVDRLASLGKPLVMGLPFGHSPINATLPVGALATLDANAGDLIIEESAVAFV